MPKPWYSIKAAAEGSDTAEVSILEPIHPFYGCDAKSFLAEFRAVKAPNVKLYINSPGGSVIEGLAIYNGMRASGKKIEAHVLGIAASMASYVAMAADKIVMPRNTLMLPHKPMNAGGGNADDHRALADTLDKIESLMLPAYSARFKGTEDELKALLAEDDILTAEECLAHGFCDQVTDEITATASFDLAELPPEARKVFEAVAQRADPTPVAAAPAPTLAEQIKAYADERGLSEFLASFATLDSIEAARKRIDETREIVALGALFDRKDVTAQMVREGKTLAQARVALAEALAADDAKTTVKTAAPAAKPNSKTPAVSDFSPSALWGEIHAMKKETAK